ncbi:F0F1 ATP synthase subunit B [Maritalea porphyrae]|uniref:ATP synthase subunit b n=1 Tax=Maritalea porphyrae TaxID=880732 RepID=A0ABQ5URC3_9HYPH|nr:F0F1 ATP synthase subunit B [Maritalea porphyrae]GLQ17794.1 ATP synthase subunit b 2 [Maritalea porphyrae]
MASNTTTSNDTHATEDTHATTEAHGGNGGHSDVFPPFDPASFGSQLLWLALSFAALYILMSKIALPRIGEILEVRRDRIEGDLAEAERLRQKTDQAIEAYETDLANAKQKAHTIAEETREAIRKDLDAKRADVETDLAKKMATAESRIQSTKTEALGHVEEIASDTAHAMVTNLLGRTAQKATKDAVAKVVKG